MNAREKLYSTIGNNEALMSKLDELLERNGSEEEMLALLNEADIKLDEDAMQELLALRQRLVLANITTQEIDDEQLSNVAGGGNGKCDGKSTCDEKFKWDCNHNHDKLPLNRRCKFYNACDEFLGEILDR